MLFASPPGEAHFLGLHMAATIVALYGFKVIFLGPQTPLLDIQAKIEELRHLKDTSENIANELSNLQDKFDKNLFEFIGISLYF